MRRLFIGFVVGLAGTALSVLLVGTSHEATTAILFSILVGSLAGLLTEQLFGLAGTALGTLLAWTALPAAGVAGATVSGNLGVLVVFALGQTMLTCLAFGVSRWGEERARHRRRIQP